ncbi:pseudouridine synthase [Clostridium beijerinckii]|uniref:Pseudouridine synthase n=1 Tax=Clostridium beijerinckii TaxID=1520 RepID=A0A7X9XPT0_CLOBE|nr:RNA pseudouridine synthase [Clostridium beijerinckii]NMF05628.1 pseudouridine synthase [Clostridium beijerinckii]
MRINKLFSNYGICSRKETNRLIEEKRIIINGRYCVEGQWVNDSDEIIFDGKPISTVEKVYIILNKPVGITCTAENKVSDNIISYMKYPHYIFPVGRLDKDSQGLILMTNDGEVANRILESDNMHEKEYLVQVNKNFDDEFLKRMSDGLEITGNKGSGVRRISDKLGLYKKTEDKENLLGEENLGDSSIVQLKELKNIEREKNKFVKTRPCQVERVDDNTFKIILTQGMNKQIRKMSGTLGYQVIKLERIRIMNIRLNDLEIGKWRYLEENEIKSLKNELFR